MIQSTSSVKLIREHDREVEVHQWDRHSPDLNPAEDLWDVIEHHEYAADKSAAIMFCLPCKKKKMLYLQIKVCIKNTSHPRERNFSAMKSAHDQCVSWTFISGMIR